MSFGWSISDILALGQMAFKVVQSSRKACGEYDELTREVTALHAVLQRLELEISKSNSAINQQGDSNRKELQEIAKDCRKVLRVLDIILDKYNALDEDERRGRRLWQKLKFGNGEMNDLADIRSKVVFYTSAMTFYLNLVNASTLGRMEEQMIVTGGVVKEIQVAVNNITIRSISNNHREGSILTTYSSDDKAVWKEFRRELIQSGFSSLELQKHKSLIQAYVKELGARGILDETITENVSFDDEVAPGPSIDTKVKILPNIFTEITSQQPLQTHGEVAESSRTRSVDMDVSNPVANTPVGVDTAMEASSILGTEGKSNNRETKADLEANNDQEQTRRLETSHLSSSHIRGEALEIITFWSAIFDNPKAGNSETYNITPAAFLVKKSGRIDHKNPKSRGCILCHNIMTSENLLILPCQHHLCRRCRYSIDITSPKSGRHKHGSYTFDLIRVDPDYLFHRDVETIRDVFSKPGDIPCPKHDCQSKSRQVIVRIPDRLRGMAMVQMKNIYYYRSLRCMEWSSWSFDNFTPDDPENDRYKCGDLSLFLFPYWDREWNREWN